MRPGRIPFRTGGARDRWSLEAGSHPTFSSSGSRAFFSCSRTQEAVQQPLGQFARPCQGPWWCGGVGVIVTVGRKPDDQRCDLGRKTVCSPEDHTHVAETFKERGIHIGWTTARVVFGSQSEWLRMGSWIGAAALVLLVGEGPIVFEQRRPGREPYPTKVGRAPFLFDPSVPFRVLAKVIAGRSASRSSMGPKRGSRPSGPAS